MVVGGTRAVVVVQVRTCHKGDSTRIVVMEIVIMGNGYLASQLCIAYCTMQLLFVPCIVDKLFWYRCMLRLFGAGGEFEVQHGSVSREPKHIARDTVEKRGVR